MNDLESTTIQCPYCGELIDILIDCSITDQSYIEDCQVCCQPITVTVQIKPNAKLSVWVSHQNE